MAVADTEPIERVPPAICLVRPREEGNVGAAARAMANLGLERLLIVEPAVRLGATARAFAVHAAHVLDEAERFPDLPSALAPFQRIVATTAARERVWAQRLLTPRELPARLAADPPGEAAVILFGPETSGLTNDELALASLHVRIPTTEVQPTLNLAQAVVIVAYELFVAREAAAPSPDAAEAHASGEEVAGFAAQLESLLHKIGFARDSTIAGVERDLRQLVARAEPTRREVRILRGVLRRLGHALDRAGSRAPGGRRTSG